jgi:hypothetical protein
MSKRLDLHSKEQESTSHQATLLIGGIDLINTRIWANMQGGETRRSEREKMPKGAAATATARAKKAESKGGGHGHKQRAGQRTASQRREERTQGTGARGKGNIGGRYPRTKDIGNAEVGTPRADMAQTARDSRVAPQMRGRHENLTERQREHREQQPAGVTAAHTARKRPRKAALGQGLLTTTNTTTTTTTTTIHRVYK